jgi:exodeoxyribonuclease VII small subunit
VTTALTTETANLNPGDKGSETEVSFEDTVKRLTKIVEQLERGDLPLEQCLQLFEQGVKLARASQARLDAAERRVEQLLTIDEQGNPIVRELPPE